MKEALDGFVTRDDRAGENSKHHGDTRQIFHSTVAIGESLAGFALTQDESDPQRNGRAGVAEIVNRICQQGDAAGKINDHQLQRGGHHQPDE